MKKHNFTAKSGVYLKSIKQVSSVFAAGCGSVVGNDKATGLFSVFAGLSLDCMLVHGVPGGRSRLR